MLELALHLIGHTHPRALAESFLGHLREATGASALCLRLDGDAEGVCFARHGELTAQPPRVLPLPGLGELQLYGQQRPLDELEQLVVQHHFVLAFNACRDNERERAFLRRELGRSERVGHSHEALQRDTVARIRAAIDAQLSLLQLLEMDRDAAPGELALVEELRGNCREVVELLDAQSPAPAPEEALPNAPSGADPSVSAKRHVLIVEDFEPLRTLLALQLKGLDCEVSAAADGAEALQRWRRGGIDLVITDLNMPVMDGVEFVRALRAGETGGPTRVPVIGLTAAAEPTELARCRAAGMDETLLKPVDQQDIAALLARWGRRPAAQQPVAVAAVAASDPELDLGPLQRMLGADDIEQALAIVDTFLAASAQGLNAVAGGIDGMAELARELHKQKSGARSIGALRYARRCDEIEAALKRGQRLDIARLLQELDDLLAGIGQQAARQRAQRGIAPAASKVGVAAPASGEGLPRSVLVVDDDEVMQQQLVQVLRGLGIAEVVVAGNGREALACLQRRGGRVDLVLTDLHMPVMDGVELLRALGRDDYDGAIVLLSGSDDSMLQVVDNLARLYGLRVLGSLAKPVERGRLLELLDSAMEVATVSARRIEQGEIPAQAILKGIARGEFSCYFQPQVDAFSLRPVGVEALARWRRQDGSMVPPDQFIVAAERMDLIGQLSELLVVRALDGASRMHRAGFNLRTSINLSAAWLTSIDLPDTLGEMVRAAGLQPRDIVLEVTETGVAADLSVALDILSRLRLRGFGLSIDDFGVGYSSFEQLQRFPFTELKLDRSFVSRGGDSGASRAILESTMKIASSLRLEAVAEGVETEADLALVRELGCPVVQGYLVARPMPVDDLIRWLQSRRG